MQIVGKKNEGDIPENRLVSKWRWHQLIKYTNTITNTNTNTNTNRGQERLRHCGEPGGVEVAPESAVDGEERGASRNPDAEQEGAQCEDKYALSSTGRSSAGRN